MHPPTPTHICISLTISAFSFQCSCNSQHYGILDCHAWMSPIPWCWGIRCLCQFYQRFRSVFMMTSWNGNIFRVTGPLCGEFTGEFPSQSQRHGALMCYLICARINGWVNNLEAGYLKCHRAHHDVIVIDIDPFTLSFTECYFIRLVATIIWIFMPIPLIMNCTFRWLNARLQ